MAQLFFHTLKIFTWDLARDLGYWPVWWYSRGLKDFFRFFAKQHRNAWRRQGLGILTANWFKPMYAQSDIQGRIISFFFRTLMILWRAVFFLIWAGVLWVLALLWILILPLSWGIIIFILLSDV